MAHKGSTSTARSFTALVGIALATGAFLRGNFLLGTVYGITSALIAAAIVWMFAESVSRDGGPSIPGMIAVGVFALSVGIVLAFPAAINSDVQHFIDKQATDRTVRGELNQVFASDTAFSDLSISTIHVKVVNVTISGELPSRNDLLRLRQRIFRECPTLKFCPLHWDVRLRDTNDHVNGVDRELFSSSDDAEQVRQVSQHRRPVCVYTAYFSCIFPSHSQIP